MNKRLTFSMLNSEEKRQFESLGNLVDAETRLRKGKLEMINPDTLPGNELKADYYIRKAGKSLISPIRLLFNLSASTYYRVKSLGDITRNMSGNYSNEITLGWSVFILDACDKYGCDDVNWNAFPGGNEFSPALTNLDFLRRYRSEYS
jgi:hypothetical protein